MGIPADLLSLYSELSWKERLYIKARWLLSPVSLVESAVPKKGKIYDIGCGVGLLSNLLALLSNERDVTGLDLSEEKIAIARRSITGRPNISFKIGNAVDLQLADPDAVTACDLLHHIPYPDQERLVAGIYASLNRGGIFILQDIDRSVWHKYIFAYAVDMLFNKMQKVFYRTSGGWAELLQKSGFEVEKARAVKGYPIAAAIFVCRKGL